MDRTCGICMDTPVFDTIGVLLCGHNVCVRCQLYLNTDGGCPYCRRQLYDVSAWYITLARNSVGFLREMRYIFDMMGDVIMEIQFGESIYI